MLLFILLESGLLDASRGDVILFNNTSAEHPITYRFVQNCREAAKPYGIPFFLVEFQTYEDSSRGEIIRRPSYRLVNQNPYSGSNPDGFRWRGEVFEELLSWKSYLPNIFDRVCTKELKLEVTRNFLADWLASKTGLSRLGHFDAKSRINQDTTYQRHLANNGSVPKDIFLKKRGYCWKQPHFRPAQNYKDFCSEWRSFENAALDGTIFGGRARFDKGAEYLAFIGLRGDEAHRVERVIARNAKSSGYEGEHAYMPLSDMELNKANVNAFWNQQTWDLVTEEEDPKYSDIAISNCVYCFLKGASNLNSVKNKLQSEIENSIALEFPEFGSLKSTPSDLRWWIELEKKYARDLKAENRKIRGRTHIGFFGSHPVSYSKLMAGEDVAALNAPQLPCDCTE